MRRGWGSRRKRGTRTSGERGAQPKAPTARGARASGAGVGAGGGDSWGSRLQVPQARNRPSGRAGKNRGLALLPRAPRRPTVFSPASTHHPVVPLPHDAGLRTPPAAEGDQATGAAGAGRHRSFRRLLHPAPRAAPRGPGGCVWAQRHLSPRRRGRRRRSPAVPRSRAGDSSSLPPTRGMGALPFFCAAALTKAAHLRLALFHFRCTEIRMLGDSKIIPRLIVCFGKAQVLGIK